MMRSTQALSVAMLKNVNTIMSTATSNFMTLQVALYSTTDAKFQKELGNSGGAANDISRIKSLSIVQNFRENYRDVIELEFEVVPQEFFDIIDHSQNLMCNIVVRNIDIPMGNEEAKPLLQLKYRVIIKNKTDLLKQYARGDLVPTASTGDLPQHHNIFLTMTVELIDQIAYTARKQQFNFINRGVSINDTLHLLAKSLGAKQVYIVPPDNIKLYNNLIVPPMSNLSEVFTFLQYSRGKGVYEKGLSYYYTNDVIYIYPCYETNPQSPKTTHIYNVGEDKFLGSNAFHNIQADETHLITTSSPKNIELVDLGLENTGSAYLVQYGEKIVDRWMKLDSKGVCTVPKANFTLLSLNTKAGVTTDVYSPKFKYSADNIYAHTSDLSQYNRTKITNLIWRHAMPFTFRPGYRVMYHYDGDGVYQTRTGMCEAIVYMITKAERLGKQVYGCVASMQLSITND